MLRSAHWLYARLDGKISEMMRNAVCACVAERCRNSFWSASVFVLVRGAHELYVTSIAFDRRAARRPFLQESGCSDGALEQH